MNKKEERVCQYHKLSIRKNGNICPCCISNILISNVYKDNYKKEIEENIITCECGLYKSIKPKDGEKPNLKYLHIEFSNECQARCLVCFQHKEKLERENEFLSKLSEIISTYKPKGIIAIGGEVLIQEKTMDWLLSEKIKHPEICVEVVTNLCVSKEKLEKALKIFDILTISMLGFQKHTYNEIMGLDIDRTFSNIEILKKNNKIIRPKFLAMPTNFLELPLFFEWALTSGDYDKIYLHNTNEFENCINLSENFWGKSFDIVEKRIKKLLETHKDYILSRNKHLISIHHFIAKIMHIDYEYLKSIGLEQTVKVAS